MSVPLGGTISTMVTNSPAASLAPSRERSSRGRRDGAGRRHQSLTWASPSWRGPRRRAAPTSSRGCGPESCRSIRRPGERQQRRICAHSSPCIRASTDKCFGLPPSAESRRWAARKAAAMWRRAGAPLRPAWPPGRRCNCSRSRPRPTPPAAEQMSPVWRRPGSCSLHPL